MDALLLRSLQSYVTDTFSFSRWQQVCFQAGLTVETFEPMLRYDAGTADRVALAVAKALVRPVESVWEDVGTYLVTHPNREGIRRLLRFGGTSYTDFLHSLEELPGRARLAVPDKVVPELTLNLVGSDEYQLCCQSPVHGLQYVMVGLLTAMADDYGALCTIEAKGDGCILISVIDRSHTAARQFNLARQEA